MCFTKCHKAQKKDQHQKIIKGKKAIKRRGKKNASLLGIILLLNYAAALQEITLSDLVKVFYLLSIFLFEHSIDKIMQSKSSEAIT